MTPFAGPGVIRGTFVTANPNVRRPFLLHPGG